MSIKMFCEGLPDRWIFRDQGGRNDYGIDAEVELVTPNGELRGEFGKVQLKSQKSLDFSKEGYVQISGVKQTTLRYWLGISRSVNVVVAVTDQSSRESYFTPAFWQAAQLLDGSSKTCSIRFSRELCLNANGGPVLFEEAIRNRPFKTLRIHEDILRELAGVLHDYLWCEQADPWAVHGRTEILQRWLERGNEILGIAGSDMFGTSFDFGYWQSESDREFGDNLMFWTARNAYLNTMPAVFKEVQALSDWVQRSQYYFRQEMPEYLELVNTSAVPSAISFDEVLDFIQRHKIEES